MKKTIKYIAIAIAILVLLSSCSSGYYIVHSKKEWEGEFTYEYIMINKVDPTDTIHLRTNRNYEGKEVRKIYKTPNLCGKKHK